MNLSFAGCGYLGLYHVGVAVCIKKYAPQILFNKITGTSAGSYAASCLLCDAPLGEIASDMLELFRETRTYALGAFSPSFRIWEEYLLKSLDKVLPEDAHLRVNGKLHISLTRISDGQNVLVSQFDDKKDLLIALEATSFIPIFSGFLPPKFHGVRYIDGGFSNNLPSLDENTITVSPFCGETDICPRDDKFAALLSHITIANTSIELTKTNIFRFARVFYPSKPEILTALCHQGYEDTLRFLLRHGLINCSKCPPDFGMLVPLASHDDKGYDPQCEDCKLERQEALMSEVPDIIIRVFQQAIDKANRNLYDYMLSHKGVKLVAWPLTLSIDILRAIVKKTKRTWYFITTHLIQLLQFMINETLFSLNYYHLLE